MPARTCEGIYKIVFHFEAFEQESVLFSFTMCIAQTSNSIARLLQSTTPSPSPLLYIIHHTILAMAILCKWQHLQKNRVITEQLFGYK